MNKLGFIGMGNMAQALAAGFIKAKAIAPEKVFAFAPNQEKLQRNAKAIGFTPVANLAALADAADTLIMACTPCLRFAVCHSILACFSRRGSVFI